METDSQKQDLAFFWDHLDLITEGLDIEHVIPELGFIESQEVKRLSEKKELVDSDDNEEDENYFNEP